MNSATIDKLRAAVRDVADFPKAGIVFKDITPMLSDGKLFRASIDLFLEQCRGKQIDKIVGIDARGFLFGSAVAYELNIGFVPIRKRGKLPYKTERAVYTLEYTSMPLSRASGLCWSTICSRREAPRLLPPRSSGKSAGNFSRHSF